MPATGPISIYSLLRYPFIAGRFSRIAPNTAAMSRFYGVNLSTSGSGSSATINTGATNRSANRDIVYDILDNTRTLGTFRAPGTGPMKRQPKVIGQQTVRGLRSFDSIPFKFEDLRNFRALGSPNPTMVDPMAANYIAAQTDIAIQRIMNTREFVFNRMLKGSMGIKVQGDDWWPVVPNSGGSNYDFLVDWQLPASHRDRLEIITGSPVINASWANAGTDFLTQLHTLRKLAAIESGLEPTEMWMNSTLFAQLQNNTKLQAIGGQAFRVFDQFRREVNPSTSTAQEALKTPMPGYYYQFRALPQMNIHVYDGVVEPGVGLYEDTYDANSAVPYLDDTHVLITPAPSQREWFEVWDIMEYVAEQYGDQPKEVYGFHTWSRREHKEVPSVELTMLDNFAMALKIPKAIYYAEVVF